MKIVKLDDVRKRIEETLVFYGQDDTEMAVFLIHCCDTLPSAQPEKRTEERTETHGVCLDVISRQAVLALPRNKVRSLRTYEVIEETINVTDIEQLPSAQPEPTQKQVEYAKYLANRMCQKLHDEYTKEAYSKCISKWKPVVKHEDEAMNEPSEWQMRYT